MKSITTVTGTPATVTRLTTLTRVKSELSITVDTNDTILDAKIDEATSDIEAHTDRVFCRETLTQTFWGEERCVEDLVLSRAPVGSITSVTVDDVAVDAAEIRLDAVNGRLYRLTQSSAEWHWYWSRQIVVVFVAGFLLPGEEDRNLPAVIESACIDLIQSFWANRGRDPQLRAVEIPGVIRREWWIGAVGRDALPPLVMGKIAPFRRVLL